MQTIITAAGRTVDSDGSNPKKEPKGLVDVEGVPILRRAVNSYVVDCSKAVVALNAEEECEFALSSVLSDMVPNPRIFLVPTAAEGALASAVLGVGDLNMRDPLVVAAGDSEISGGIASEVAAFLESGADANTLVFPSNEPRWSYLSVSRGGSVSHVAEKRVVGPYATTGVFMFRSVAIFLEAAQWCFTVNARVNGRFYVSTTLNHLIYRGLHVSYEEIPRSKYRSWSLASDLDRDPV